MEIYPFLFQTVPTAIGACCQTKAGRYHTQKAACHPPTRSSYHRDGFVYHHERGNIEIRREHLQAIQNNHFQQYKNPAIHPIAIGARYSSSEQTTTRK